MPDIVDKILNDSYIENKWERYWRIKELKRLHNEKLIKKLNKYAFVKGLDPKQTEEQIIKKWLGLTK
tara:strand:- start:95 stop:295 length:201 start_codon:yes stop_codon:yes gene_type:complete